MIELIFIFQAKDSSDGGSSTVFSARGKTLSNLNGIHWRSPHYPMMLVGNKKGNLQGRSPNEVKVIFHTTRNCS